MEDSHNVDESSVMSQELIRQNGIPESTLGLISRQTEATPCATFDFRDKSNELEESECRNEDTAGANHDSEDLQINPEDEKRILELESRIEAGL
jgi:hypothetical protein